MRGFSAHVVSRLFTGVSAIAIIGMPSLAQDAPATGAADDEEIVVTGIRASLVQAMDIKRDAIGVVDAISAEEMGKFPDTNLAESLQRITGVSIDRSNGEGQFVTVRGFGPEFNLITLNGRMMPTSSLGDGASAPSTRSFDFANIAAEGIAGVQVYKTGRATVSSGGIGATINILTPRPLDKPGLRGSLAVRGVLDTSRNEGNPITPEVSGIISDTFADERIGVLVTGTWQKRKSSVNKYASDWRDGYTGAENNWGSLAQPGDPRYANITNRPGDTDVYEVPQNGSYALEDVNRERINGQAVLQVRPVDGLTATLDYTFAQNTVEVRNSNVGVWFNHNATSSAWTDGPVAGPEFYAESFGGSERKDLSYSGSLTSNRTRTKSFGANLTWEAPGGVTIGLDYHKSSAESKPTNDFGTSISVGNAVFGVINQGINFEEDLPVISVGMAPGVDALDPSLITPGGNAFRNAYFRNDIQQVQLSGRYEHDEGFLDSIDFGVSYSESKVRSAYGFIQNETWSGAGPASDIPDDIFTEVSLPDKFKGVKGSGSPDMLQSFYAFDFERMVGLIEDLYGTCSDPQIGSAAPGSCLANFTTDRRLTEKTLAPFLQINSGFDILGNPAHFTAGLRYESTTISSAALVPIPNGSVWSAANEFYVVFSDENDFTRFKGDYENWLPNFDFDFQPIENLKLRASYSHTITRADYESMQGGLSLDAQFRINGGTGSRGNPGLLPYKSKNIDFSAEWYYAPASYVSAGYFHKDVSNFIGRTRVNLSQDAVTHPGQGPRYQAAVAALGANAQLNDIRQYIFDNFPATTRPTGVDPSGYTTGDILGVPGDPLTNFEISTPSNSDQTAAIHGWEFAVQHAFWDTGFGVILNYTIVNGDAKFDNAQPATVVQFALTGLSDSANVVAFYDKNGIQARIAYNWRDKFLTETGPNPFYVEPYGQIDASASWEFMPGFTGFVEVINLTGSDTRGHKRHQNNTTFVATGDARYSAGLRYNF